MTYRRALARGELWSGEMRGIVVDGVNVVLANVDGVVVAYQNRCAHQDVPLSQGRLLGCVLTCSAHEWQYDIRNGEGINPRAARLIPIPVRIEGEDILVDVDPPKPDPTSVGPVLTASAMTTALIAAICEENEDVKIVHRGAYLRVLVPHRCQVTRAAIERHTSARFELPTDLEVVMVSFKGRLTITSDEATWELGGGS